VSEAVRIPGDEARVSILVAVEIDQAFWIFTQEIDRWWRVGLKYRIGGKRRSTIHLEPRLGGRFSESLATASGERIIDLGVVTAWEPPTRLVFDWRGVNFDALEKTEVEVTFSPSASGTMVTVKHRGWSRIRADHPARHGLEVPAFIRMMGLWWGDLMTSLRKYAASDARLM
jgi:uncharacterized protein YndB with AHSA1/START domain